ncbi:MAG TPA: hypothetical protein VGD02_08915 [Gemmatimonadaceae bacterium]
MSEIYSPTGNVSAANIMRATAGEAATGTHGQEFMRDNITRIMDRIRYLADDGQYRSSIDLTFPVKDSRFNAKGNGKTVNDAAITSGTPTLTSATAAFTAADVGKTVFVRGAGAAAAPLVTTILAFVNGTTVTLATNASTTVSGKRLSFGSLDTAAINLALAAVAAAGSGTVSFAEGTYIVDDEFNPPNYCQIVKAPGVEIIQVTTGKGVWAVISRVGVSINFGRALITGPGVYSNSWTGMSGHEERGLKFYGCTDCSAILPRIRNFGNAGWAIRGGTRVSILFPEVEGTHVLGQAIVSGDNYQAAGFIEHSLLYGSYDQITVFRPVGFNTAQGLITEDNNSGTGSLFIPFLRSYAIKGQHGAYFQCSNIDAPDLEASDCALDGFKIYSGISNPAIVSVVVRNFKVWDCVNGQASLMGVSGSGNLSNCHVSGTARNCARAFTASGDLRGCSATVEYDSMLQNAFYFEDGAGTGGANGNRFDIFGKTSGQESVYVAAPLSKNNKLRFKGLRSNTTGAGASNAMVYINACTSLELESPDCVDDGATMGYCVLADTNALGFKITGTPNFKGYTINAVRAIGIIQWHALPGDFTSLQTAFFNSGNNVVPITQLRIRQRTTSTANGVLWQNTVNDESSCTIYARLTAKKDDSTAAATFVTTVLVRRDAGGAPVIETLTGPDEDVNTKTSGFVPAYSWNISGNLIRLLMNSGAPATNVDWVARVELDEVI